MEERDETRREERLPGEVVEVYRRADPREVVETYVRPLPGVSPVRAPEKKQRKKTGLWIFLACVAAAVILAIGARVADSLLSREYPDRFDAYGTDEDTAEITIPAWPTGQGAELPVLQEHGETLTAQEVYQRVNPAVVTVIVQLDHGASLGTGVIFTADGYIITNYHVVEGGHDCTIALDTGYSYMARYVAGDADSDLAVLKVDGQDLPTAVFGDSDLLTVGDKVYAIGNPLGVELRGTLTDGIVSAINRDVRVDDRTMTLIQTNAALNSGNSGGPLINEYGQVVGINVIKMSSAYSNVEGLGFAIPSATMDRIVNDLLEYGEPQPEPALGVTVLREAEQLGADLWGLEVLEVTPGSAADAAGIQVGDFITAADGETMTASRDLLRVRRKHHLGDRMSVTLWRDGETVETTLVLLKALEA